MQVDVGQLLFVLDTKTHSIVPAQVDEVLVSKTVKGETVQHKLVFPNGKITRSPIPLNFPIRTMQQSILTQPTLMEPSGLI